MFRLRPHQARAQRVQTLARGVAVVGQAEDVLHFDDGRIELLTKVGREAAPDGNRDSSTAAGGYTGLGSTLSAMAAITTLARIILDGYNLLLTGFRSAITQRGWPSEAPSGLTVLASG